MLSRRRFLATMSAGSCAALVGPPNILRGAVGVEVGRPLPIPPLMEPSASAPGTLEAIAGRTNFLDGAGTRTAGFDQTFLGPVVRLTRGASAPMRVRNRLSGEAITCHWHGLAVPGHVDGGPHQVIAPDASWSPELDIDQPAATMWYHSHLHGRTAEQVVSGLAGMLIVEDPDAPDPGLPKTWEVDDLPLIIQDRSFQDDGAFGYAKMGHTLMHGFRGDEMLVNGVIRPTADVPAGLTRLRLLNASNARTYVLHFEDERSFHQVASGGGLLPAPVPLSRLELPPASRAEIVVDFGKGGEVALRSEEDPYEMGMGMGMGEGGGGMGRGGMGGRGRMGQGMGRGRSNSGDGFEVMRFRPDASRTSGISSLPGRLAGAPEPNRESPVRRRTFELNVHGGGMGMGGMGGGMTINGDAMDMEVVNHTLRRGETELWEIVSTEMPHPFHVHGGSFTVVSRNGEPVPFESRGLDDVVLVNGTAEILVRMDPLAPPDAPFMYHCHILEHEDSGMMGQFTVEE
ncbi:MAG: multicopper oxidase family protein [Longimicrobiales bacterium]